MSDSIPATRPSPAGLPLTLAEMREAFAPVVRGDLPETTTFRWIERNSREVQPGDLFIAVKGERFDGHTFVADASRRGAAAALVSRSWAEDHPEPELPLLVVEKPVVALQRLAAHRRSRLDVEVIGITGSIGKTSTKEVIASVLAQRRRTYRSPGNMNSEIGLPLSLLEVSAEDRYAVLEMGGAYAFGELALLAQIARPLVGVVTNVHPVHLERMGTIEAIAQTKAELPGSLPPHGIAVLNGDDFRVRAMAEETEARVLLYGRGPYNDVHATAVQSHGLEGMAFRLMLEGQDYPVRMSLTGSHAIDLALAAAAVGLGLSLQPEEIVAGLETRGSQVRQMALPGPRGSRLIDDTYNASAPSVLSALGLLAESPSVRRIAVLGEMRELGEESDRQHRMVGTRVGEVADLLVTFGPMAQVIGEAAAQSAKAEGRALAMAHFDLGEREALVAYLQEQASEGDTILLKGSRGLEMETIVTRLAPSEPVSEE